MARNYYDRVAEWYDTVVDQPIRHVRASAARSLAPRPGGTVLDVGCGSGVNFEHLRAEVGSTGQVVGVDISTGMLSVASGRIETAGWENVSVVQGDATRPPVEAPDAVFASLLSAFFEEPAPVVREWASLVRPGGRIGLLDFGRATDIGRLLNPLFVAFVGVVSPSSDSLFDTAGVREMERRNAVAHRELASICSEVEQYTAFHGFARITVGTVEEDRPATNSMFRDSWPVTNTKTVLHRPD